MNSTYAQKSSTVQKAADTKAASVFDSSAQNESLQRKADMANNAVQLVVRNIGNVVQRVGEANEAFEYYPDISGDVYKDRVPYNPQKICFTPYTGGEVKSAGFCGCFMMVFHFVDCGKGLDTYRLLISKESEPFTPVFDVPYVAHVPTNDRNQNMQKALVELEDRGLIKIEALFRPCWDAKAESENLEISDEANDLFNQDESKKNLDYVTKKGILALIAFTAGVEKNADNQWIAKKYSQEKRFNSAEDQNVNTLNFRWKNSLLEEKSAKQLDEETLATRICLYAEAHENEKLKNNVLKKDKIEKIYGALYKAYSLLKYNEIIKYWMQIIDNVLYASAVVSADPTSSIDKYKDYINILFDLMDSDDNVRTFVFESVDENLDVLRTKYLDYKLSNV